MKLYLSIYVLRVVATNREFTMGDIVGIFGKVESELILFQLLRLHQIVEKGRESGGRHFWVSEAKNAIEIKVAEDGTIFRDDFGKILPRKSDFTQIDCIGVNQSFKFPTPKLDIEVLVKSQEGGGFLMLVLFVATAAFLFAAIGVHPKVGAASVEDNFEVIELFADRKVDSVLDVFVIVESKILWGVGLDLSQDVRVTTLIESHKPHEGLLILDFDWLLVKSEVVNPRSDSKLLFASVDNRSGYI